MTDRAVAGTEQPVAKVIARDVAAYHEAGHIVVARMLGVRRWRDDLCLVSEAISIRGFRRAGLRPE
jgi:hypothetical protein